MTPSILTPFTARSPWNCKIVGPVFDPRELPATTIQNSPTFECGIQTATGGWKGGGKWSTAVNVASATDPEVQIQPFPGKKLWNLSAKQTWKGGPLTIRWPRNAVLSRNLTPDYWDGHCVVFNGNVGTCFWKLHRDADGILRADCFAQVDVTKSWGFGSKFKQQGTSAAGSPMYAGLVRKHERDLPEYAHGLRIALPASSMTTTYVAPAVQTDVLLSSVAGNLSGQGFVPMGAYLMIPSGTDLARIKHPILLAWARTAKKYPVIVCDQTGAGGFSGYAEYGVCETMSYDHWAELDFIRKSLRMVTSYRSRVDGNGYGFENT